MSSRGPGARDGEDGAAQQRVAELVRAHAGDVLAYLQRRTDPVDDAADVLGETLAVALRRRGDLPAEEAQARMWLFATARRVLANHRRARRRADGLLTRLREQAATALPVATSGHGDDLLQAVREAVAALPAGQREVVALVHWDGFTLAEAAMVIGVPASTARTRYASARERLALALTRDHPDPDADASSPALRDHPARRAHLDAPQP